MNNIEKAKFLHELVDIKSNIEKWQLYIDHSSKRKGAIGYYFEPQEEKWMVYENSLLGARYQWRFLNEEDAIRFLIQKLARIKQTVTAIA